MQAHNFSCEICGDKESTLHIHHKQYLKGYEPWDYKIDQLSCVCETCHEINHSKTDLLTLACSFAPLHGFANRDECAAILIGLLDRTTSKPLDSEKQKIIEIGQIIFEKGYDFTLEKLKGRKNG
jgi:hypothetical protein